MDRRLVVALLGLLLVGCFGGSTTPATPTPLPTVAAVASPVALSPLPPLVSPTPLPPLPTPTPQPLVVANTEGQGVSIRRTPGTSGERIKVWPDGTLMQPQGDEQQADGLAWKRVRDPDDND